MTLPPTFIWASARLDLECDQDALYVMTDQSALHNRPSLFARIESLEVGLQVCVAETRQRIFTLWYRVRTAHGAEGWINASHLGTHQEYLVMYPATATPTQSPEPTRDTTHETAQCTAAWGTSSTGYAMHTGPGTAHTASGHHVIQGEKVCVLETVDNWIRIRKSDGISGYIHQDGIAYQPPATPTRSPEPTQTISLARSRETPSCTDAWGTSTAGYRIRSGPGTAYTASGQYVLWGEKVCVLETIDNWVHIQTGEGSGGYIHQDGIAYQPPATLTPTTEPTQQTIPTATTGTGSTPTSAHPGTSSYRTPLPRSTRSSGDAHQEETAKQPTTTPTRRVVPTATSIIRSRLTGPDLSNTPYHTLLSTLTVAPHTHLYTYDRDDWGSGWSDADRDCQNTRHEVLELESREAVTFRSTRRCHVVTGLWIGPWSGETFTQASDLDIDHHVPLKNAHISGGATWSSARKRTYYNDMQLESALQATKNSLNRAKSAQGPEAWKPPLRHTWCQYARDWIEVKAKYELSVTQAEKAALASMLNTCDAPSAAPRLPTPVPPTPPTPTTVPLASMTPARNSSDPKAELPWTNGYQCSTTPYRHLTTSKPYVRCSDFASRTAFDTYYEGAFHTRHDRDKDCLPCESLR